MFCLKGSWEEVSGPVSAHLLELSLWVDVHVARLTVKRFVLQACWWFGGCSQFAFDTWPGERLNGAHAGPGLQHRLVLRTCRFEHEAHRQYLNFTEQVQPEGGFRSSCLSSVFFFVFFLTWGRWSTELKGQLVNCPIKSLIKVRDPVKNIQAKVTRLTWCLWVKVWIRS